MTLSYTATLLEGFLLGVGLIVGIGPQNTFVLRQSLSRQHLFVMVALCVLLDALLLVLGVYGLGELVKGLKVLSYLLTLAGAIFLLYYVFRSFRSVFKAGTLSTEATFIKSRRSVIVTLLATSLLNPSLYLDTLFVVGGTATHLGGSRLVFVVGAILASLVWFASLSYGAALLAPLFKHPLTLRLLDTLSGCVMGFMAYRLFQQVF
jgi:L-lysine exporter family protein LysE/ArgO